MKIAEITDRFVEMEEENSLFETRLLGEKIWPVLRLLVYPKLILSSGLFTLGKKENIIKKCIRAGLNALLHNTYRKAKKSDFLFIGFSRRVPYDGKWLCVLFDFVVEKLDNALLLEQNSPNFEHKRPTYTSKDKLIYDDTIQVYERIYKLLITKLYLSLPGKTGAVNAAVECVFRAVQKEFPEAKLSKKEITIMVKSAYADIIAKRRLYGKLFDKIKPKVVISWFSISEIQALAKERGIITITVSDGEGTSGYNAAWRFPPSADAEYYVDYVFSSGKYWNTLMRLPISEDRIIISGFPYINKLRERFPRVRGDGKTLRIVILPSWSVIAEELEQYIRPFLDKVNVPGMQTKVVLKPHPAELEYASERYANILDYPMVELCERNENLYSVLARSDVVISTGSSSVYSGFYYGVRTYILNMHGAAEALEYQIKNNYVRLVSSGEELAEVITDASWFRQPEQDEFFTHNATPETYIRELKKIVASHPNYKNLDF